MKRKAVYTSRYEKLAAPGQMALSIQTDTIDGRYPHHNHEFWELVIILSGKAMHVTDGCRYEVEAGDVFLMTGGMSHSYDNVKNLKLCNIRFDPVLLAHVLDNLITMPGYRLLLNSSTLANASVQTPKLNVGEDNLDYLRMLAEVMKKETEAQRIGYEAMVKGVFIQLITFIARHCLTDVAGLTDSLCRVARSVSYIHDHFHTFSHDLSLKLLSSKEGLSVNTYLRTFKRVFNMTPVEYIQKLRIDKACKLLAHTSKSISDIAFECGFSDSNYFSRRFRTALGTSPRGFRKKPANA